MDTRIGASLVGVFVEGEGPKPGAQAAIGQGASGRRVPKNQCFARLEDVPLRDGSVAQERSAT